MGFGMGKPLSMARRARGLASIDSGMSRRAAAKRFGVGVSSVIRWDAARRATGDFAPKARGDEVMMAFEAERDQTRLALSERFAARGIATSKSALSRFFQRRGITRKNVGPAPLASGLFLARLGRAQRYPA